MSRQYPGGIISANVTSSSTTSASGMWRASEHFQRNFSGYWPGSTQLRDGSTAIQATTPSILRSLGIITNGTYWIWARNVGTQPYAYQAYVSFNMVDGKDWVLMMQLNQSGTQGGNVVGADLLGSNIPWKGFCLDYNGSYNYGYFGSYSPYATRSDTTAASSGNKSGYRCYLGNGGGHGWYTTSQGICSWSEGPGSIGAGYDGSCGTYPSSLRMGTGQSGSPQYSLATGTYKSWVWMDTAT